MIQEAETQHYSAVLCRSCRQPIPLPAIVVGMASRSRHQESGSQDDPGRVFTLRCRSCDKEKPYRVTDIVESEGTPKPRLVRARRKPGHSGEGGGLARAAHI
jgi:hypothetical protein